MIPDEGLAYAEVENHVCQTGQLTKVAVGGVDSSNFGGVVGDSNSAAVVGDVEEEVHIGAHCAVHPASLL